MNRDTPLLRFHCGRDAFGETICTELEWLSPKKPVGYRNLTDFLLLRQAPKHRKHMAELLERYGCPDTEGFLRLTHALSLNDTLWVRETGSALRWDEVSLYRNPFDELIARAAFDGEFSGTSFSSTSPEFGTDGLFAKCWVREEDGIFLYKSGSSTFEIEPLSEYLACQVARRLKLKQVEYDLAFYHGKLVSKCRLFTDERVGLVKARDLAGREEHTISALLRLFDSIGEGDTFRRMCVLDALILNTDRHLGNFGVLTDNESGELLGMAPVFDHNRSLLYDMDERQLERTDWCIGTCRPRIGTDFIAAARGLLTEEIRRDLSEMRDFSFEQHPGIRADENRLSLLSRVVRRQTERILGNS